MDEKETQRILIDVTSLFDQYSKRGIGRYTKDLLNRLLWLFLEDNVWEVNLLGFNDLKQNLIEIGLSKFSIEEISEKIKFHSLGKPYNSSVRNIFKWKDIEDIIYEVEPDVYYATHFERGLPTVRRLRTRFKPKKTIVTVHDVIPLVNNKFSRKNPFFNYLKGLFYKFMWTGVEESDLVLTCSEFSKKDLINYGHIPESNIKVIYLGINEEFFKDKVNEIPENDRKEVLERFQVNDEDYFLYDSGLEANKGIDNLIEILDRLFKQNKKNVPNKIVIVGGDFYQGKDDDIKPRSELGRIYYKKLKTRGLLKNIVTTSRIPDEELQILLFNSKGYIYLSEYEGFGFGPIQAMAAEVPSIVNNASCLPEITSGASLMVEANDHDKTVKEIIGLFENKEKIKELIAKGKEVVSKYKWDKTASKTYKEISTLLKNSE